MVAAMANIPPETTTPAPARMPPRRRRLILLVLCGVLLVASVLVYRHYWMEHPIGSGPAGPVVAAEPFQSVWSERKVLFVGLGDSMTAGFGAEPLGNSYFNRLVENPVDEFPEMQGLCLKQVLPQLSVENLAVSGSTSIEHSDSHLPKLEVKDADTFGVVAMTTGGNDVIHNYGRTPPREGAMYGATLATAKPWITNFRKRLDQMIEAVEERFPGGCCIFLGNIYDPTDAVGDIEQAPLPLPPWPDGLRVMQAYNQVIADCAARHGSVHLVDIHGTFLGHGLHAQQFWQPHYDAGDPHYWYFDNLEDPNNRGYDAIRRLFLIEMARVLPQRLQDTRR